MSKRPVSRATSLWVVLRAAWCVDRRLRAAGDPDGATVPQIRGEVTKMEDRRIAYSTVATQLKALVSKGMLAVEKRGRNLCYRPAVTEPDAVAEEVGIFITNILHHEPQLMQIAIRQLSMTLQDVHGRSGDR